MNVKLLDPYHLDKEFLRICSILKPSIACDIGTRDCESALAIKRACPSATVFAFEASPENFYDFCLRPEILEAGIFCQHLAISNTTGSATLNIPDYASRAFGGNRQQRGMSSLLEKNDTIAFVTYKVASTTIDDFFFVPNRQDPSATYVFWIDVEGISDKVISGMQTSLEKTLAIKVELESTPYYQGQELGEVTKDLLARKGFVEICRTIEVNGQYDTMFLSEAALDLLEGARP